jgi:hypothetical protein
MKMINLAQKTNPKLHITPSKGNKEIRKND